MRRIAFLIALLAAPAFAANSPVAAHLAAPQVVVEDAHARPTYGQARVGAGYLRLRNDGAANNALLSAASPIARRIELHTNETKGDIMRMRMIERVEVPAGGSAALEPGGMHLMFFTLSGPLTAGMTFPVTLHFAEGPDVIATFQVR